MPAPTDRSFVPVGGAGDVLAAALGAGSPHAAARRLRDMAPTLDVTEARAAAQRDGHGFVIATHEPAALAVRWFAPGAATASTTTAVGAPRWSWTATTATSASSSAVAARCRRTFWLEPGDVVSWQAPPGDVHRQQAADGGHRARARQRATAPEPRVHRGRCAGSARPLADALLAAYRGQRFAPLRAHYHDDVASPT